LVKTFNLRACINKQLECCKVLIDGGAQVSIKNNAGKSCVTFALQVGDEDMVTLILSNLKEDDDEITNCISGIKDDGEIIQGDVGVEAVFDLIDEINVKDDCER
jgi:ankyrin repeat protein